MNFFEFLISSTGDVIPDNLIEKIQKASLFNQGFITTELAAAALIDMDIHTLEKWSDMDINDFEKYNLATRRGLIPQIEPRYRYTYFSHIFNGGYSSGYYFYLWAEVLDKDAFEAFKLSHDLCDKELAHSFRYDLLAQGGQLISGCLFSLTGFASLLIFKLPIGVTASF